MVPNQPPIKFYRCGTESTEIPILDDEREEPQAQLPPTVSELLSAFLGDEDRRIQALAEKLAESDKRLAKDYEIEIRDRIKGMERDMAKALPAANIPSAVAGKQVVVQRRISAEQDKAMKIKVEHLKEVCTDKARIPSVKLPMIKPSFGSR